MSATAAGWLAVGAIVVTAFVSGYLVCWATLATRRAAVAGEAADLANYAKMLDMRRASMPVTPAATDSGFGRKQTPSDLPARNSGIIKAQEDLFVPASQLAVPIIPGAPGTGKRFPEPSTVAVRPRPAPLPESAPIGDLGLWLEDVGLRLVAMAPGRLLAAVALTWALLDRKIEPARPLDAPMAYRPPAAVVATARVVKPTRCVSAAYLLDRLRAERKGEALPEVPVPRTASGRHAINAVPGAPAQRDRSTADRQRYEARAARATTGEVRVWDTHEMVMPPAEWVATAPAARGGA